MCVGKDRYRTFVDLQRRAGCPPFAIWREMVFPEKSSFGARTIISGMGRHPAVVNAMIEPAVEMGAGAGGTRNISGDSHPVVALDAELADLHRNETALIFTSG